MRKDIRSYNTGLSKEDKKIAARLAKEIDSNLTGAESKVWHRHPVWFLDGNPIVGYSRLKDGMRLMFWSGRGFKETKLKPGTGRFKDASITYTHTKEVKTADVKRWLKKATKIQWDYKNIVKRRGKLMRLY